MLTVEKLNAFGANTAEGIARCINNEAFYLRMVDMAMSDANFGKLKPRFMTETRMPRLRRRTH